MEMVERWIIKLTIIQLIGLLAAQLFLHHYNWLPQMNRLLLYEGVEKMKYSEILDVLEPQSR
ncbi:DUF5359 family protein [Falsibacillus pallidus]|uniref:Uncharacterized protein n=1 Tax=Falsibacillus pallidus TaxID=493781 RepID=A0A370GM56_9BACI|nr:DUF5359 family protein [Falsibacillus pallidus]RDI42973.1 hypothetical protein DFR59_10423 [Falsibacillus pallidus]